MCVRAQESFVSPRMHTRARASRELECLCPCVCWTFSKESVCAHIGGHYGFALQEFPEVHIKFPEDTDTVAIDGPKDDVFAVQKKLTETIMNLVCRGTHRQARQRCFCGRPGH